MVAEFEKHYVVVPYPGFGHIIPMLELAKKIMKKYRVTIVMPAMILPPVQERILLPTDLSIVTFESDLTFNDSPDVSAKALMMTVRQMLCPLTAIFKSISPTNEGTDGAIKTPVTAVIMDYMYFEAFEVCHSLKIPTYLFSCPAAWIMVGHLNVDENTPTIPDDLFFNWETNGKKDDIPMGVPESLKDMGIALLKSYPLVEAVIVNSFEDLESSSKMLFEKHPRTAGTPMKFVGPLFPENEAFASADVKVKEWLDRQQERSVVFVSFGTAAFPHPEQIAEIANALMELKKPFIWSLKSVHQVHLPEQFLQLTKEKFEGKFLVLPWAPQKTILGHPSTQVFVSHCGWNSSLECIYGGVSMIAWPMFGDQHLNAERLVQQGMAVKIPNTSFKAKRLVPKSELLDALTEITAVDRTGERNNYEEAAQKYSLKARAAVSENGKSSQDFQDLFL